MDAFSGGCGFHTSLLHLNPLTKKVNGIFFPSAPRNAPWWTSLHSTMYMNSLLPCVNNELCEWKSEWWDRVRWWRKLQFLFKKLVAVVMSFGIVLAFQYAFICCKKNEYVTKWEPLSLNWKLESKIVCFVIVTIYEIGMFWSKVGCRTNLINFF